MNKIKSIVRYPIKGLSGENLENITLEQNQVLPEIGRAHVRTPVTRGSRMPSSA